MLDATYADSRKSVSKNCARARVRKSVSKILKSGSKILRKFKTEFIPLTYSLLICVALRELQVLALHTDEMKGVAKMFSKEVYITKVAS